MFSEIKDANSVSRFYDILTWVPHTRKNFPLGFKGALDEFKRPLSL